MLNTLTKRQAVIATLLFDLGVVTTNRLLEAYCESDEKISQITLTRELKVLSNQRLIFKKGRGRATMYFVAPSFS